MFYSWVSKENALLLTPLPTPIIPSPPLKEIIIGLIMPTTKYY